MPEQWPAPLTPVVIHDGQHNFATKSLAAVDNTLNVRMPEETAPTLAPENTILLRWSTYLGMVQRECTIVEVTNTKILLASQQSPTSIQRRQFFRGQIITRTLINDSPVEDDRTIDLVGQSVDLSEGGMLVSIAEDIEFEEQQEVTLRFVVDSSPLYISAIFLRSSPAFRGVRASFKFVNASADVMTAIRKSVFESQLDKRE